MPKMTIVKRKGKYVEVLDSVVRYNKRKSKERKVALKSSKVSPLKPSNTL